MTYDVVLNRHAKKQIRDLPSSIRRRVDARLLQLEQNPRERGTKKLKDAPVYRVRIGDYRILYEINDARRLVEVHSISHRSEAYQ